MTSASKLALLQKLLCDREHLVILYRNLFLCSCGSVFEDLNDVENHLVSKHDKVGINQSSRKNLQDLLQDLALKFSIEIPRPKSQKRK